MYLMGDFNFLRVPLIIRTLRMTGIGECTVGPSYISTTRKKVKIHCPGNGHHAAGNATRSIVNSKILMSMLLFAHDRMCQYTTGMVYLDGHGLRYVRSWSPSS